MDTKNFDKHVNKKKVEQSTGQLLTNTHTNIETVICLKRWGGNKQKKDDIINKIFAYKNIN